MILPSKHLSQDRAMLTLGARILGHLSQPLTVSALWERMRQSSAPREDWPPPRYDGFVLALDLLFLMDTIELRDGILNKKTP